MLLVTEAKEQLGERKDVIAKETGIHPFVVQKVLRVLPSYPRPRLAKGLRILSALDVELKLGQRTPEGALQHFIFQW
jgi:DNA polymerase III delta subunit